MRLAADRGASRLACAVQNSTESQAMTHFEPTEPAAEQLRQRRRGRDSDLSDPSEPTLPHNLAAERTVLGACLLHAEAVRDVAALQPHHFYWTKHGVIFAALRATNAAHGIIDPVATSHELQLRGELKSVGGSN